MAACREEMLGHARPSPGAPGAGRGARAERRLVQPVVRRGTPDRVMPLPVSGGARLIGVTSQRGRTR